MVATLDSACSCSGAWESPRRFWRGNLEANGTRLFIAGVKNYCWKNVLHITKVFNKTFEIAYDGPGILALADGSETFCAPAVVLASYACVVSTFLSAFEMQNELLYRKFRAVLWALLLTFGHCLREGNPWMTTTGQIVRQLDHMKAATTTDRPCSRAAGPIVATALCRLLQAPAPLCIGPRDSHNKPALSPIIGRCRQGETTHRIILSAIESVTIPSAQSVSLCTHTSVRLLGQLERQLVSWRSATSIAVLLKSEKELEELESWHRHWAKNKGLYFVRMSVVFDHASQQSRYDQLYPANVLRQVALNASFGDLVLLADPGFVPSASLSADLSSTQEFGAVVRDILRRRVLIVVAAFEVHEAESDISVDQLYDKIEAGLAASFDWLACPMCRPYAWQWLLLESKRKPWRFRQVVFSDLNHPVWLGHRSSLTFDPRLRGLLSTVAAARKKSGGWAGFPRGLRSSADKAQAEGYSFLMLPAHFVWRPGEESSSCVGAATYGFAWDEHEGINEELLYREIVAPLPLRRSSPEEFGFTVCASTLRSSSISRSPHASIHNIIAEVVPYRNAGDFLVTLRSTGAPGLQVIVVATTVVGSPELDRLVTSLPWPVHALAVGSSDIMYSLLYELPVVLRTFDEEQLILVSDAYDVMLLPCKRDIVSEFLRLGKEIAVSTEQTCWRGGNPKGCPPCGQRYAADTEAFAACRDGFPNLNGGGALGSAAALAQALTWMAASGDLGVSDIQGAWWEYYEAFPERVALDHRHRIWATVGFLDSNKFRVLPLDEATAGNDSCGMVIHGYTGEEICFIHASEDSRVNILKPIQKERAHLCGTQGPPVRPRVWAHLWHEPERSKTNGI